MSKEIIWEGIINLQPITKKNSQRIGKNKNGQRFVLPSAKYERYEREASWEIRPPREPIDEPVNVKMLFYMGTKRRCDLVNHEEACLDLLVHAGVLSDDNYNIVYSMDGSRVFYDKENPRTEIEIARIDTAKDSEE